MANYNYVIDSTFQPFSMQEMLVPFSAYKDAYEKSEEQYNDLSDKSDKFKYLSETLPEGSKARKLYEGYANDLAKQAEDLAHNGLSMSNRRALTSLRRRYQGEIGRLLQADEAMREEKKLRRSLSAQDSSMLYAIDNLDIDSFLDGETPNLYNISGNELYTRGAAAGKAASSRVFSAGDAGSTLNGYYRDYVQKMGYSRDTIQKFYQDMSAIPELQMAADAILEERGVNQNLTGNNLQRARQSVINGMIDGAIYQENHNPTRDLGVLTPGEKAQIDMQQKQFNLNKSQLEKQYLAMGFRLDDKGRPYRDEQLVKDIVAMKLASKGKSGSNDDNLDDGYTTKNKKTVKLTWHGNNPNDTNGEADDDYTVEEMEDGKKLPGRLVSFNELPFFVQERVKKAIGGGKTKLYRYYYQPFERGWWKIGDDSSVGPDTETEVAIVPADVVKFNKNPTLDFGITDNQE
nr:MAG TPA: hypothetical protein [Crassvirales sp.]